jgi:hypothetical protein
VLARLLFAVDLDLDLDHATFKASEPENQKPLTLALSRRERGLIAVVGRCTPTCNTELYTQFEKPKDRLPLQGERAGVRGSHTTNPKPTTRF